MTRRWPLVLLGAAFMLTAGCATTPATPEVGDVIAGVSDEAACNAQGGAMSRHRDEPLACIRYFAPEDVAACHAQGGKIQRMDPIRPPICVIRYDDAKACTDGTACQSGICLAESSDGPPQPAADGRVHGRCATTNVVPSCGYWIENGVAKGGVCF